MGEIADRLNELSVTVQSPDGNISATVKGPRHIQIGISQSGYNAYVPYNIGEFEHQLSQLATLTWTRYQRGVRDICGDTTPDVRYDECAEGVIAYNGQRAQIEAGAESADGVVSIRTRGMVQWSVSLDHALMRQIAPQQFLTGLSNALKTTVSRYLTAQYQLRDKLFGDGLPDRFQPIRALR